MNKIEKRSIKGELKYKGSTILTYNIEYPEITESTYNFGMQIFNNYNKQKALRLEGYVKSVLYEDAKQLYDYNAANGYPIMVYEIILDYTITYNEDCIISLYYDQYEFTGGAHGNTIRTSQNWDLRFGRQIKLSYFFPNNDYYVINILREINKQIQEQIASGSNYYFDNYCQLVLETFRLENYYLTPNAIAIYFQQYDIAPYSSGIPVFYIPYYGTR